MQLLHQFQLNTTTFINGYTNQITKNVDNNFFDLLKDQMEQLKDEYPEILSPQEQKERMKCPKNNQAYFTCICKTCEKPGLMCMNIECQCRDAHFKCYNIRLQRVLNSINDHQKEVPAEVKQSYKTTREIISQMIERLSKMRRNLQLEEKFFGLGKDQLEFMELIEEKKIQMINGKIISNLEKTFETKPNFLIANKDKILKDFASKKINFENLCLQIQLQYSKYDTERMKFQSKIIKKLSQQIILNRWISEVYDGTKKITNKLLFRASQHNFEAQKFHKHCDGIPNTLLILRNQLGKVIGGFAKKPYQSNERWTYVNDETGKSFVFSIDLKEKFKCVNKQKSIYNCKESGPTIGANDIYVYDNANTKGARSSFPSSYGFQPNSKYRQNENISFLFSGTQKGKHFKVQQYEVYQIIQE